jgi:hypothetical protein
VSLCSQKIGEAPRRTRLGKIYENPIAKKLIELDNVISDFYASKLINSDIGIVQNVSQPYPSCAEE